MIAFLLTTTLGRALAGAGVAGLLLCGAYFKGRLDAREACQERTLRAELATARADLEAARRSAKDAEERADFISDLSTKNAERVRALELELEKEGGQIQQPPPADGKSENFSHLPGKPPVCPPPYKLSPRDAERLRAIR